MSEGAGALPGVAAPPSSACCQVAPGRGSIFAWFMLARRAGAAICLTCALPGHQSVAFFLLILQ